MADFDDERQDPKWTEVIKKVIAVGVSGAVLSEEVIKNYLQEVKLPRELLNLLVQGAQKSKEEVATRVSKEIALLLAKVDIVKEASRFVETHKFRVSAEIEVLPKSSAPRAASSEPAKPAKKTKKQS